MSEKRNVIGDIRVVLRCEGWDRPMYGHYGILPPETHNIVDKYKSFDIESYSDFDRYVIFISKEDDEVLKESHIKYMEQRELENIGKVNVE